MAPYSDQESFENFLETEPGQAALSRSAPPGRSRKILLVSSVLVACGVAAWGGFAGSAHRLQVATLPRWGLEHKDIAGGLRGLRARRLSNSGQGAVASDEEESYEEEPFNGTLQLSSLAAKSCSQTRKANQCLMFRAKKADRRWSPSWTHYRNNDTQLKGPESLKTDCSGFVTWALKGCIKNDVGKKVLRQVRKSGPLSRTRAGNFYDAFGPSSLGSSKWCQVPDFRTVQRGDVLVYKIKGERDGKDTGHIMIAYTKPRPLGETHDGRLVFAQKVIDSSSQPHFDMPGDRDTRSKCPKSKKCGAGVGYVYVFTDTRGKILAIRIRGTASDRNAKTCTTKSGTNIACFPTTNYKTHLYRVGRLLP